MISGIIRFIEFWTKKKWLFAISFISICLILFNGVLQLQVNQSIYSILPKGEKFENLNKLLTNKNFSNKVFFLVDIEHCEDEGEVISILQEVSDSLNKQCKNLISPPTFLKENTDEKVYNYYYSNFPVLIDSNYYSIIDSKSHKDSIQIGIDATYRNLISPGGSFLKKYILNDPLFLTSTFFKSIESRYSEEQMTIENGILYSKDQKSAFIYTDLIENNTKSNEELYKRLNLLKDNWNTKYKNTKLDYFGTFEIGVGNSLQVKKDTILTVSITIASILLILFLYYRKFTIPIFFTLPALFSALFALGIIGYIKPEISGLSLATGAILFGIILDYSFHFFTHLEHTKSIELTIKEIVTPLTTGSLTTILAFAALLFANSVILQDFGLFASLALVSASIFTILILPIFLNIFNFNFDSLKRKGIKFNLPKPSQKAYFLALILIVCVTIFMFFKAKDVQFDQDISNLSFHQTSLKEKENQFVGINPDTQKKIYLFSKAETNTQTIETNYSLFKELKLLKSKGIISSFHSTGDFLIPQSVIDKRQLKWNNYWAKNNKRVLHSIDSASIEYGFNESAFSQFKNWISVKNKITSNIDNVLLDNLELTNLLEYDQKGTLTLLSTIVVENEKYGQAKSEIEKIKHVEIFNRKDMATSLVELVKDDFNYLLYGSAAIVFFALLVIYGRIELTLLAFSPMIISWIWILGFSAIFDIKFNFVNIVITTFIFGLGDDFSIFVTDGLLAKYKLKKDSLKSFKTAIILSATTTIIGTGVLYFAKHPAIHSIAVLSILGISCILFISLVVQPVIFNFFVQKRVDSKKPPISLFSLFFTVFLFGSFFIGCLTVLLLFPFIVILPIAKKKKQFLINFLLSKMAWINVHSALFFSKKIIDKNLLDFNKPSIIIANHSSFLDILLILMLNPKVIMVVKDWVYNSPIFGLLIRYSGYIFVNKGAEQNLTEAKQLVKNGYSIVIFPEGSRSTDGNLTRFHKGAFYLAQALEIDITPILIHGASTILPKNDFLLNKGKISLKVLPRIKHEDLSFGKTYRERSKSISKIFKAEFNELKNSKENAIYFSNLIFQNYIFKGPLLEWYFKIKWKFEAKNFDFYNSIIGNKKDILDVGAGYGYFTYFLHFKNIKRDIIALDYDSDKIDIAKNAYSLNESVSFESCDIVTYDFPKRDVIFYNDILHYLGEKEQILVLKKSVKALNDHGILIIRDGITDLNNRHKTTIKTEKYSTSIVGFNKKTREFNFFTKKFIEDFAKENNLSIEMKEQSKKTSNVLFILTKK